MLSGSCQLAGASETGCACFCYWQVDSNEFLRQRESVMILGLTFLIWMVLFVLCWPLALLALVLFPIIWLLALPFRLVGMTVEALFALLKSILLLPARLLGWKPAC